MIKRSASLLIALFLTVACLSACHDSNNEISSEISEDVNKSESVTETRSDVIINVGDTQIAVDFENTENGDVRLFNKDYKKDSYIYTATVKKDRSCIVIKNDSNGLYTVSRVYDKEGNVVVIPVNGFVLDVSNALLEEKQISFKTGTEITVLNYDEDLLETLDLTAVIPSDRAYTRRINMLFPENGKLEDGKIYLCNKSDSYVVPDNSVALLLKMNNSTSYTISGVANSGEQVADTHSLLFCGEYNFNYCMNFYKTGERISILKSELLNNFTDNSAIIINGTTYIIDDEHFNSYTASGINIFNNSYKQLVTPRFDSNFICAVIADEKITYISEENERLIIPSDKSYIAVFSGDKFELGKQLSIGESVKSILIPSSEKKNNYVLIEGKQYKYNALNVTLADQNTVLYSSAYGNTTSSPDGTLEITICDGKVSEVSTTGNATIPSGGFVLSFRKNSSAYNTALKISKDAEAFLATEAYTYESIVLKYTKFNATRYTDDLVIYDESYGNTTNTNVYGYEISVDENGIACYGSNAGNSTIPKNGFVVSGHGVNQLKLQNIYKVGMSVSYNPQNSTVTFVKSPSLKVVEAAATLSDINEKLLNAKEQFYAIDYNRIEPIIESAHNLYAKAESCLKDGKIDSAIAISNDIMSLIETAKYGLYESSSVENRSVWYRSNEKNDDEVRNTVKLLDELGINALYIETWYNGQTIGYSSDKRIQHNSAAHGDYDVLEGFCRIAHEYGIEVHAWCENFFIGTHGGYLVELMKDKRSIDRHGKDCYPCGYGDFIFMNPNDRECRDLVLDVYKELVSKYDIDGIHLDYIRFSEPNLPDGDFGYNEDIIKGFQETYHTNIDPHVITSEHPMWSDWCKYREEIINSFVAEVHSELKSIRSDIYISAACYPDFPNVPKWNFQNFREWVKKGYIDEIFSMSYGADLSYPLSNAKAFISAINKKCFYSIGVSAFESTAASVLIEQIFYSKQAGASGSSPFSWGSLVNHSENYFDALKSGVYARKAVKQNKGSETVKAAMNDLLQNIDSTYAYLKPEYSDYYAKLKESANAIIDKASVFDYQNADVESKLSYCQDAVTDFNNLIKLTSEIDNVNLRVAIKRCVNVGVNAMKITVNRLKSEVELG